jgi:hypothetical protein
MVEIIVTSPFDTDILTFARPMPWPLFTGPEVKANGQPFAQVPDMRELGVGKWSCAALS